MIGVRASECTADGAVYKRLGRGQSRVVVAISERNYCSTYKPFCLRSRVIRSQVRHLDVKLRCRPGISQSHFTNAAVVNDFHAEVLLHSTRQSLHQTRQALKQSRFAPIPKHSLQEVLSFIPYDLFKIQGTSTVKHDEISHMSKACRPGYSTSPPFVLETE